MEYRDIIRKLSYVRDEMIDIILYLEEMEQELKEDDKEDTEEYEKICITIGDMQQIMDILREYEE